MSQTRYVRNVLERFDVSRTNPIPAFPDVNLRSVSEDKSVEDIPFHEAAGCLMWIANQTGTTWQMQ